LVAERPEDIGLLPDGQAVGVANPATAVQIPDRNGMMADDSWSLRGAMGTKAFWVLFFMGMAMFCVNTGTNVHIGAYYRDQGLTLTLAAVAISFSWFVSAFGSIVWGWVLEKVEARYAYSLVLMILGTSTLYLLTVDSVSGAFVAAALIGSVSAGSQVIPTLMYADYFGRNSLGKIRGISETGVLIGQSTGPLFAGLVFDLNGSYSFVFMLFGGIAITCGLIVLTATRPVRRHPMYLN
jgi:MFS family permease